jgi:hypothetical protein
MNGSLPVRYLGDITLVKLAIAVGHGEADSRRSGCRNQKPYRKAIPYEIDSLATKPITASGRLSMEFLCPPKMA